MDFETWRSDVERSFEKQGATLTVRDLDSAQMRSAFQRGVPADQFAKSALPRIAEKHSGRNWGVVLALAILFEFAGVLFWLASVANLVFGLKNLLLALPGVAIWFLAGAGTFFMGSVIRLLIAIEENTSR